MDDEPLAGRYRLLSELGRGAMSTVWLARDEELERLVAVKILVPTADRQRFEREARAVAALSDPNIGGLYDYGEAAGRPYMVLEYLSGGSLEDRLRAGRPLDDGESRAVAGEIASALAHAHARGLVHRDLKPANVLFDADGRAKLVDFGIARMRGSQTLTEAGTVLGTASTISPEQAAGATAGPASDVYSFGVILFRMLTGQPPFASGNAMELVRLHRDEPPPTVASVRRAAPPDLAALADAALAKDPAARPADGAALVAALAGDEPTRVLAPPPARRRRPVPPRWLAAGIAVVALLAGGVAAAIVETGGGSRDTGTTTTRAASVPTAAAPSTAAASTTAATSTRAASTEATTTSAPTTSARAPTLPTTTEARTTVPTTTAATTTVSAPPATTAPVTTTVGGTTTAETTTNAGTTTPATTTAVTTAP